MRAAGFMVLLLAAGPTGAVGLEEGERALAQAKRDYFQAVYSGQAKTTEERAAVYQKTIGTASSQLDHAVINQWQDAAQRRTQVSSDPSLGPDTEQVKKVLAEINGTSLNPKSAFSSLGNANALGPGVEANEPLVQEPAHPPTQETALDGSAVPRLLEFGQKKKAIVSPPASWTP